jgi:magnesium chelatase subunit D
LVNDPSHGRYVRAVAERRLSAPLAFDATLRALLSSGRRNSLAESRDALRFKSFSRKRGRWFIFVIDTSGSMALHRIGQAKVAVLNLLRQSYVQRDSVAVVGFCGASAEVLLPASKSILRARRALELLRLGGGTPLSAGVVCALELARSARQQCEITVLLFTDGHANVPANMETNRTREARRANITKELIALGVEFAKTKARLIVVDTQKSFVDNREAVVVAKQLGAAYTILPVPTK